MAARTGWLKAVCLTLRLGSKSNEVSAQVFWVE